MRIKLRYTNSATASHVLTIPNSSPVSDLVAQIREHGSIPAGSSLEIKHGFPPKPLELATLEQTLPLDQLPFKLDGDQLTVTHVPSKPESAVASSSAGPSSSAVSPPLKAQPQPTIQRKQTPPPLAKKRRHHSPPPSKASDPDPSDPPDVLLPGRGTITLRVMADDNSCLFRAISYVCTNSLYSVTELRQLVASTIQADPITYNPTVLGQPIDDYCSWITMESSWGGGIELSILAQFFDIEIISMDVSSAATIRFNEPTSTSEGNKNHKFCVVVYSGIHYDALALSPLTAYSFSSPSPESDIRIFDMDKDQDVLQGARELVSKLKERNYFTDTNKFTIKCEQCNAAFVGEKEAVKHAKQTGHSAFGEY
ncbi:hypothetical protein DFH27DRAFT_567620 [Peziza echinospora]|nr:hypothetical protein DFH27DRAFT_567620 [Peziza echinospora]